MENIWTEELTVFLAERIHITNPAHYQLILELLKSLDDNQHLVGIDVSDLKGFLKDEAHLDIKHLTIDTLQLQFAEQLFEALPNTRLLYIHLDIGIDTSSPFEVPCFSLVQIRGTLSTWMETNPDGDVLFSVVLNRLNHCLNVWIMTNIYERE